jgi:hypothetical protein
VEIIKQQTKYLKRLRSLRMATSRRKKKDYLNIQTVNKRIRKLALEALNAEMMDDTSLMLMKLNEVEVLRSILEEYKEG